MSSALSIFPPPEGSQSASPLVGIAKLASQADTLDEGHNVEYFTLQAKSVLNRCTSRRMPFTWTINPYRGCEFACKYCYARYTHEFMEMRDGLEFERKILVKQHTAWLLRRELRRVKPGEDIAIGTATDPYQPAERRFGMTRAILEEISLHSGLQIGMVTKSTLVLRDVEILQKISASNSLVINMTVTTVNTDLARLLEPRAPRPDLRLEAVKKLNDAGVNAAVICAPVLPQITDSPADLDALVRAARGAGALYVYANPLFLKPCSAKVFMPFLEQHFPPLVESYKKRYASDAYVTPAYRKKISELIAKLCRKHAMPERQRRQSMREELSRKAQLQHQQLSLF